MRFELTAQVWRFTWGLAIFPWPLDWRFGLVYENSENGIEFWKVQIGPIDSSMLLASYSGRGDASEGVGE